jgi:hypothetical protein
MSEMYPFADGDRFKERNTYFYTPYGGNEFLVAWQDDRSAVLAVLPDPSEPKVGRTVEIPEPGPVETLSLLNAVHGALKSADTNNTALKEWLAKLVQKFEVTKRIHRAYNSNFKAINPVEHRDHRLYVLLAGVFELAYEQFGDLRYLNAFLKCLDTLCSVADQLGELDQAHLAWLIGRERVHVDAVAISVSER